MEQLTFLGIFLEGLLSFFSPCVLPLVPLYMAYLSSGSGEGEDGGHHHKTAKVFLSTVFFVLGICSTFFLLAIGVSALRNYIEDYKDIISLIGGVLVIIFGLHETGIIHIDILSRELRIKADLRLSSGMNIFKAYLFGLLFSFAWTPCIGPMMANALFLAGSSDGGILYIILYCLGLVIPFLFTGLFTSGVLNFIKEKKKLFDAVMKIAGILLILFGFYMIGSATKNILSYRNLREEDPVQDTEFYYFPENEFTDQFGNMISLKDYEGKYVIINFITSWCQYCRQEIPQYLDYAENSDAVCLYYMSVPAEKGADVDSMKQYISDQGIDIPVIIDEEGILTYELGVSSYPTVAVFGPDSSYVGYASGYLKEEGFIQIFAKACELYEMR